MNQLKKRQRLSIIISKDSLTCFYIDVDNGSMIDNRDFKQESNLIESINSYINTIKPYSIYLFDDHNNFTLIPSDLYNWQLDFKYMQLVTAAPNRSRTTSNRTECDAVCVYQKSKWMTKITEEYEKSFSFHLSTPLINKAKNIGELILFFTTSGFYMTHYEDNLQFHNRFKFSSEEDILYQLQRLNVAPHRTITIGGAITEDSLIFRKLKCLYSKASLYSGDLVTNWQMFYLGS